MELNGIRLSRRSANLMFLPVSYLMKQTLLACPREDVPEFYRSEYAEQIISGPMRWGTEISRLFGPFAVKREHWAVKDVVA